MHFQAKNTLNLYKIKIKKKFKDFKRCLTTKDLGEQQKLQNTKSGGKIKSFFALRKDS